MSRRLFTFVQKKEDKKDTQASEDYVHVLKTGLSERIQEQTPIMTKLVLEGDFRGYSRKTDTHGTYVFSLFEKRQAK